MANLMVYSRPIVYPREKQRSLKVSKSNIAYWMNNEKYKDE